MSEVKKYMFKIFAKYIEMKIYVHKVTQFIDQVCKIAHKNFSFVLTTNPDRQRY